MTHRRYMNKLANNINDIPRMQEWRSPMYRTHSFITPNMHRSAAHLVVTHSRTVASRAHITFLCVLHVRRDISGVLRMHFSACVSRRVCTMFRSGRAYMHKKYYKSAYLIFRVKAGYIIDAPNSRPLEN